MFLRNSETPLIEILINEPMNECDLLIAIFDVLPLSILVAQSTEEDADAQGDYFIFTFGQSGFGRCCWLP